ncbi:hypothetical protein LTR40_014078, partial [Exophiala xenobiotica]
LGLHWPIFGLGRGGWYQCGAIFKGLEGMVGGVQVRNSCDTDCMGQRCSAVVRSEQGRSSYQLRHSQAGM